MLIVIEANKFLTSILTFQFKYKKKDGQEEGQKRQHMQHMVIGINETGFWVRSASLLSFCWRFYFMNLVQFTNHLLSFCSQIRIFFRQLCHSWFYFLNLFETPAFQNIIKRVRDEYHSKQRSRLMINRTFRIQNKMKSWIRKHVKN